MNLIIGLALGVLSGWLAALIMGERKRHWLLQMLLGFLGSMVGSAVAHSMGLGFVTGLNLSSLLISVCGACLVLTVYRAVKQLF